MPAGIGGRRLVHAPPKKDKSKKTHAREAGAEAKANPREFKLPGVEVTVWYSRWVDLMPDGGPIEDAGIATDVVVKAPPEAYKDKDPTWEKAVGVLRRRVTRGRQ